MVPASSAKKVRVPRLVRKNKPKKPADGSMTIVEHINELRRRILIGLAAIAVGTIIGYIWYSKGVGPVPSLGEILRQPYCNLPPESRFGASDGECRLLATSPFEMFILRLKVGALAGLVFSSPVWLGQIWAYITPGLKKNERRWTAGVSTAAGILFAIGAVLAYFVLSFGLEFLMTIGDEAQIAALNGEKYFNFAMALLLIFGVSFEVPLITVLMNVAGVISYEQLKSKRRYIWAFLFLFAAFITPGQDPISMVILSIALCMLMEMATQIARVHDKRKAKLHEEWLDLDDTEGSTIDRAAPINGSGQAGTGATSAVGLAPAPIAAPESLDGVSATPAPQSSSGARPRQDGVSGTYGRRDSLDLRHGSNNDKSNGSDFFGDVL